MIPVSDTRPFWRGELFCSIRVAVFESSGPIICIVQESGKGDAGAIPRRSAQSPFRCQRERLSSDRCYFCVCFLPALAVNASISTWQPTRMCDICVVVRNSSINKCQRRKIRLCKEKNTVPKLVEWLLNLCQLFLCYLHNKRLCCNFNIWQCFGRGKRGSYFGIP